MRDGRVESVVWVARATACLFVADKQLEQVQDRDQAVRIPGYTERIERRRGFPGRERSRFLHRMSSCDKRHLEVKMQCVEPERGVWRAALPVPRIKARAKPGEVPRHEIAVPATEFERRATVRTLNPVSQSDQRGRDAESVAPVWILARIPSHQGLVASSLDMVRREIG